MNSRILLAKDQYETLKEEIRKRKMSLFLKPVKVMADGTAVVEVSKHPYVLCMKAKEGS